MLTEARRQQLIADHAPRIRYLAERLKPSLPACIELDDLLQAGAEGLLEAIDHYEPERVTQFMTYAEHRIKGAMLDYLRGTDWVPRSVRSKAKTIERAIAGLEQALRQQPTEAQIAAYIGIGTETLEQWLIESRGITLLSLEAPCVHHGDHPLLECVACPQPGLDEQCQDAERKARLAAAIDALPLKQRRVLALYYHEDLTYKEIGAVLGVTESRICQIHTMAILRLRSALKEGEAGQRHEGLQDASAVALTTQKED